MYKLTLIIPTYNRKETLLLLLEQLKGQVEGMPGISITVVVDGSTDGTREALRKSHPAVTVIIGDGNWWWTRSVNEGCKQAVREGADAVLLLNDDLELPRHYLATILKATKEHPGALMGSLNITREPEPGIFFSGASQLRWWDGKPERYHPFLAHYESTLTGVHVSVVMPGRGLVIPATIFQHIGYFDEKKLPQYKADYDFVLRAHEHGVQTLISWDAVIQVRVAATGAGATFVRQKPYFFLKSVFQRHSRTNLWQNAVYYKRHLSMKALVLFPFSALYILGRQLCQFFKHKKY